VRYLPRDLLLVLGANLTLYDVSDPTVLVEVATGGWLNELHIVGPHVYSSVFDAGVATVGLANCPGYRYPRLPRRPDGRTGRPR
jgi:hypothetical protein